jgi:crossover junction endodeoxyribonuclease RusA
MKVLLPWPPRELSPNARTHWRAHRRISKGYKEMAWALAKAAGASPGRLVAITFNPPDRRARDLDNLLANMKAGLDGIASAIGVDDSKWQISIRKGEVVKGGQVVVEVTE